MWRFRAPTCRWPDGRRLRVETTGDPAAPGFVLTIDGVVAAAVHWDPTTGQPVARVYAPPVADGSDRPVRSVPWPNSPG